MEVERFTAARERFRERVAAGNDVRYVWEVHDKRRVCRLIRDSENIYAIFMRRYHFLMPSITCECPMDDRSYDFRAASRWSERARRGDGTYNGFHVG